LGVAAHTVLGPNGRRFREIFAKAQAELKQTFGMQMEEQPLREKVTLSQRRGKKSQRRKKIYIFQFILSRPSQKASPMLTCYLFLFFFFPIMK
jgi:hypothetical protein